MTRGRGEGPYIQLGRWLQSLREGAGFTSQPMAVLRAEHLRLSMVKQTKLSYLERGWNAQPEKRLLQQLATLYGVPYAELVARCVTAEYDVEVQPAKPGEPRRETPVQPALTAEEELLLGLYRTIPDKAVRREFLRMVAVAHAGLVAGGQANSSAAPRAAGEDEPRPRGKVLPIRRRRPAKKSP